MKTVKVFAPATIGNVSCGFDVLGLAVQTPGDEVIITLNDSHEETVHSIVGDNGKLPLDAHKNIAGESVIEYLKSIGSNQGVEIKIYTNMPLGSGLGSSAAMAVASGCAGINLMGQRSNRG